MVKPLGVLSIVLWLDHLFRAGGGVNTEATKLITASTFIFSVI